MNKHIIGIDISKDKIDAYCLKTQDSKIFSNTPEGLKLFVKWAKNKEPDRLIFEPTGAYHKNFQQTCFKAKFLLVKVNPHQARKFAQVIGTKAKNDKVDAENLAKMGSLLDMKTLPEPTQTSYHLKELMVERNARIRERTQIKNRIDQRTCKVLIRHAKSRLAKIEKELDEIDGMILDIIENDENLHARYEILLSIPGIGKVLAFSLLIEMPELGSLSAKEVASLAGLAPITRQSGKWVGASYIGGGRKNVRDALYMPALVAIRHNSDLKEIYERLIDNGKKKKVAIVAIMRKLIIFANSLIRDNRKWNQI